MGKTVTRAIDVYSAPDDSPCELQGRLIAKEPKRKNRYVFEDASGTVTVHIARKVFGDLTVTPDMEVLISGEVDNDHKYPNEVDVDFLAITGPAPATERPQ